MRTSSIAGLPIVAAVVIGCTTASSGNRPPTPSRFNTDMEATAELVAAMPDTIRCDNAVVVRARTSDERIEAERRWLDRFYPRHGGYRQALAQGARLQYEVLAFSRSDGRTASVCFDVSSLWSR
jgi:hypothetical protein